MAAGLETWSDAPKEFSGGVKVSAGNLELPAQTVAMADAQLALTRAAITSSLLFVDPQSAGVSEDLLLPPEADCDGLFLVIVNTADGAEDIIVKDDSDTTTVVTISQNEIGVAVCDGTTWRGGMMAQT